MGKNTIPDMSNAILAHWPRMNVQSEGDDEWLNVYLGLGYRWTPKSFWSGVAAPRVNEFQRVQDTFLDCAVAFIQSNAWDDEERKIHLNRKFADAIQTRGSLKLHRALFNWIADFWPTKEGRFRSFTWRTHLLDLYNQYPDLSDAPELEASSLKRLIDLVEIRLRVIPPAWPPLVYEQLNESEKVIAAFEQSNLETEPLQSCRVALAGMLSHVVTLRFLSCMASAFSKEECLAVASWYDKAESKFKDL